MLVIPAIDIKGGKVVRLSQGKFQEITIYSSDPVAVAQQWKKAGAALLHVVDLDGAEKGEIQNFDLIVQLAKSIDIPVQMGGGIRNKGDISKLLSGGVSRVILGTKVVEDKTFLKDALLQWADKIIVSLDCSHGIVAQKGWTSVSTLKATQFAKELQGLGLRQLIYTDIARDGTLSGPNIKGIKEILQAVQIPVIASGGVSELTDISQLQKLEPLGLTGVIVGKAIYEGRFHLSEAIYLCSPKKKPFN